MSLQQMIAVFLTTLGLCATATPVRSDDAADQKHPDAVRRAVERGLAVVQRAARAYPEHRKCFACHHQTLPLLGMTAARDAALAIDAELPPAILKFTETSFRGKIEELRAGEGIGGRGLTVGYGLWTLQVAGAKSDDLTEAMVTYLLKTQEDEGFWGLHAVRPPAEESIITCTVLAAYGIKSFAAESQREAADAALARARAWLANVKPESHEDRVARLWGLHLLGGSAEEIAAARKTLVETQRPDGGWSQLPDLPPDGYATATALYALLDTAPLPPLRRGGQGGSAAASPATEAQPNPPLNSELHQAIDWLVKHQLDDGSWHVQTRAKPVQVYFDNGDPHGKDQFISMAATGWATAALARTLPR